MPGWIILQARYRLIAKLFGLLQDCCQTRGFELFVLVKTEIEIRFESPVWNPNKYSCSDPKNEQPENE